MKVYFEWHRVFFFLRADPEKLKKKHTRYFPIFKKDDVISRGGGGKNADFEMT